MFDHESFRLLNDEAERESAVISALEDPCGDNRCSTDTHMVTGSLESEIELA